jgi:hypothetical protein
MREGLNADYVKIDWTTVALPKSWVSRLRPSRVRDLQVVSRPDDYATEVALAAALWEEKKAEKLASRIARGRMAVAGGAMVTEHIHEHQWENDDVMDLIGAFGPLDTVEDIRRRFHANAFYFAANPRMALARDVILTECLNFERIAEEWILEGARLSEADEIKLFAAIPVDERPPLSDVRKSLLGEVVVREKLDCLPQYRRFEKDAGPERRYDVRTDVYKLRLVSNEKLVAQARYVMARDPALSLDDLITTLLRNEAKWAEVRGVDLTRAVRTAALIASVTNDSHRWR